ncbi:MAG: hypothetical protein ACPLRJ_02685 [Infirmifilum uzonense]|uniref:hypothetical protein n=1 Tax=Infirmifilum uzonense TaxID=1550241 RepID=UPI003C70A144
MNTKIRLFLEQLKNPAILIPLLLLLITAATGLADPDSDPIMDPYPTPKIT